MSGPKDRDVMAEAAGRRAQDALDYTDRHATAERDRIISGVMARIDHASDEPLDPTWAVQKWIELHAAAKFQSHMRRIVAKGAAAATRNADFHPDIG